jgi:F0F1-type ATP synthase assembly protein I
VTDSPEPSPSRQRAAIQLTALGLEFSGSVLGGLALGYYLDQWLETHPWLFLIGTFAGLGAALLRMMQLLKRFEATRSNQSRR